MLFTDGQLHFLKVGNVAKLNICKLHGCKVEIRQYACVCSGVSLWCGVVWCGVDNWSIPTVHEATQVDNAAPSSFFFPSSLCQSVVSQEIWTHRRSGFTHILAFSFSSLTVVVYCSFEVFPFFEHFWSISVLSCSYCTAVGLNVDQNLTLTKQAREHTVRRIKAVYSILSGSRHHHSNCDTIAKNQASTVHHRPNASCEERKT